MARIKEMREEREKQELLLIKLRKDLKINLDDTKEVSSEQNSLEQKISKLKEDLRKSQVKYDMKVSIKKQQLITSFDKWTFWTVYGLWTQL